MKGENMYKIKLIGNVLIFVGLLLLIISILINNIPLLSIIGIVIVCIGFIFFYFVGNVQFVTNI